MDLKATLLSRINIAFFAPLLPMKLAPPYSQMCPKAGTCPHLSYLLVPDVRKLPSSVCLSQVVDTL